MCLAATAEYPLPRLTQNPYVTDEQRSLILLPEWRKFLRLGDPRRGARTLKKHAFCRAGAQSGRAARWRRYVS